MQIASEETFKRCDFNCYGSTTNTVLSFYLGASMGFRLNLLLESFELSSRSHRETKRYTLKTFEKMRQRKEYEEVESTLRKKMVRPYSIALHSTPHLTPPSTSPITIKMPHFLPHIPTFSSCSLDFFSSSSSSVLFFFFSSGLLLVK